MNKNIVSASIDSFNTFKLSNKGVKMPLTLPDGTPTKEFLIVCGSSSKKFMSKRSEYNQRRLEIAKMRAEQKAKAEEELEDLNRGLVAVLIVGWSFDEECNETNVKKFLYDAPQIQAQVDTFAGDYSNFFTKPPSN